MRNFQLLGITVKASSKNEVLEKILKYIKSPAGMFHIVSLNPENIMSARRNKNFKKVIETAQIQIIDGIGVAVSARMLGYQVERMAGVDLLQNLIKYAGKERLDVLFIGGKANLANDIAECQRLIYTEATYYGLQGIKNISEPQKDEETKISSIVAEMKPRFCFVAFGSPEQELWLDRHKDLFKGCVCMGVGGGFDYLGGTIPRAPQFVRTIGLEWLDRLIRQPWRWRRQLQIFKFISLVMKEYINNRR